jgi:hypothetical protein
MSRVRIHSLAGELGMSSAELMRVAQSLGYSMPSHASTVSQEEANTLRSLMFALAGAGRAHRQAVEDEKRPEQDTLMLVQMGTQDVRVSKDYRLGFTNMVKVVAALLSDLKHTVRTDNQTVSWGNLYFLRADRSIPRRGKIELEYGEDLYGSQRQKGIFGDILWSMRWLSDDIGRPFQKLSMLLGLTRDPEGDYRNQFESDLRALESRGRIKGLDEWEVYTGTFGRNIYLKPKREYIAKKK